MSYLYGTDWNATLRSIAGGGTPGVAGRGSQPAPQPAGSAGSPAGQGRSLVAAGATSPGSAGWQAAASAVDLPASEAGEFQELASQEEHDDAPPGGVDLKGEGGGVCGGGER